MQAKAILSNTMKSMINYGVGDNQDCSKKKKNQEERCFFLARRCIDNPFGDTVALTIRPQQQQQDLIHSNFTSS